MTLRELRLQHIKQFNHPPGGYFKPSPGEKGRQEIQRFRARELARLRSFGKKIKVADDILRQCTGQTQLDPPCAPKEV